MTKLQEDAHGMRIGIAMEFICRVRKDEENGKNWMHPLFLYDGIFFFRWNVEKVFCLQCMCNFAGKKWVASQHCQSGMRKSMLFILESDAENENWNQIKGVILKIEAEAVCI